MTKQLKRKDNGQSFDAAPVIPQPADKPRRPRLSELPGAIPITDTAAIAAALNKDAFWRVMAKCVLGHGNTTPDTETIAELPISEGA